MKNISLKISLQTIKILQNRTLRCISANTSTKVIHALKASCKSCSEISFKQRTGAAVTSLILSHSGVLWRLSSPRWNRKTPPGPHREPLVHYHDAASNWRQRLASLGWSLQSFQHFHVESITDSMSFRYKFMVDYNSTTLASKTLSIALAFNLLIRVFDEGILMFFDNMSYEVHLSYR